MASIEEEVANAWNALLAKRSGELTALDAKATDRINEVNAKERQLSDDFIGFRKGLTAPAIQTLNGQVLLFDPLFASPSQSAHPDAQKSLGLFGLLIIGSLAYFIFKKGK